MVLKKFKMRNLKYFLIQSFNRVDMCFTEQGYDLTLQHLIDAPNAANAVRTIRQIESTNEKIPCSERFN